MQEVVSALSELEPSQRQDIQSELERLIFETNWETGTPCPPRFQKAVEGMVDNPKLFLDVAPEFLGPVLALAEARQRAG